MINEILIKHKKYLLGEGGGERANLRDANLRDANLVGANLEGANLEGADILTFQFNKHFAYSHGDRVKIGCKDLLISEWFTEFREIGENENYTETEIEAYGAFIKLCAKVRGVE